MIHYFSSGCSFGKTMTLALLAGASNTVHAPIWPRQNKPTPPLDNKIRKGESKPRWRQSGKVTP